MPVPITRLPLRLRPDPRRVITRLFRPGDTKRVMKIVERVQAFSDLEVDQLLTQVERDFQDAHPDLREIFAENYRQIGQFTPGMPNSSEPRMLLIGACFTMDYALESVALFNPSIVPAIVQDGAPDGAVRFLMSLRAIGEGHISSIVFRTGWISAEGDVQLDPQGNYSTLLKATARSQFLKSTFLRNLAVMSVPLEHVQPILDRLADRFTLEELAGAIDATRCDQSASGFLEECADTLISLTRANYQLHLPHSPPVFREAEFVIFPFSDMERHGIEDLRLVRFTDDDGGHTYYGTFTAFDGGRAFPKLLEYSGGNTININLITGACAKNKGMALFPRRIRGKYAMISRIDNENLYYMESDDILAWEHAKLIQEPKFAWQVIQIGNCGSPIETDVGWLLMTHGVGPMREYSIGTTLLDRDEPWRVIGQSPEPVLRPIEDERAGYVPNVVYSCGAMVHNGMLIIPYAMSDVATSFARVDLDLLLGSLR